MKWITAAVLLILIPVISWSLTFEEVVKDTGLLIEDTIARLEFDAAEAKVASAAYPGDVSLGVQPEVQAITPYDGMFAQQLAIEGSVSISLPLGLSAERKDALENAIAAASLAEKQLSVERSEALFRIWTVYQNAWIAQEEESVLAMELDAAEKAFKVSQDLFESGTISFTEFQRSEELLRESQVTLLEGQLATRIGWLELAYAANLDPTNRQPLESFTMSHPDLPRPPELTLWALENDLRILEQREGIRQIEEQLADLKKTDLASTVRTSLSVSDHSVSLSYNTVNKSLSGTYGFPVASIGEDVESSGGPGGDDTWSLGLAVNLSFDTGRETKLENGIAAISLEQERAKLAVLEESLGLEIRTSYQKYILGQEAVLQAERNLDAVTDQVARVRTLFADERATEAEMTAAAAQAARAEHQLAVAQVRVREALYATAASASYLNEFINNGGK